MWFRYYLYERARVYSSLFLGRWLFQQFIVDAWATCEQINLDWHCKNQRRLRAELYNGLQDAMVAGEQDTSAMGHHVVLPSLFPRSPQYFQQLYQDSMAIVRHFGKPSLFITFTANTNWPEVQELLRGADLTAADWPDLVARAYHLKMEAFMADLHKHHIFGHHMGHCYRIEYQKRGLPHSHLLLFLHDNDHFLDPATIDEIICVEFPSRKDDPELHSIITAAMVHGLCRDEDPNCPCMTRQVGENFKWGKGYPKALNMETTLQANGFPLYQRHPGVGDNPTIRLLVNRNTEVTLDNQWVVPYNLYLSKKYQAHINVAVCDGV
jgi:hypothetical protein